MKDVTLTHAEARARMDALAQEMGMTLEVALHKIAEDEMMTLGLSRIDLYWSLMKAAKGG